MNVEIIAVGTELLLGQIANSNAQFLSQRLAGIGANVYFHTVVGDNVSRLQSAIETARSRADILLFTGGLGPTEDDLTKEVVANMIGKSLVYHEETLNRITAYYRKIGREMTENNKKQAIIFENSNPLLNEHGMAVGCIDRYEECMYILLPGPPSEMKPMFTQYVEPYLLQHASNQGTILSKMLRFFGIGESSLETEVLDLLQSTNPTVAPLASDGEVALRITAKDTNVQQCKEKIVQMEQKIVKRVGQYIYGSDEDTLTTVLSSQLKQRNWKISFAESLTGGLCASTLTSLAGSSDVIGGSIVSYSNNVKRDVLGVQEKTLKCFGAVSEQCAMEMATNVQDMFHSHIGVSLTGVAGPTSSEGKEVGTVYIGMKLENQEVDVIRLKLAGTREQIRVRAMKHAYFSVIQKLMQ